MWTAAAIVLCAVLFLVDKNHKWNALWKVCAALVLIAIGLGIFLYWQDQQTATAANQRIQQLAKITEAQQRECTTGDVFDKVACEKAIEARFH